MKRIMLKQKILEHQLPCQAEYMSDLSIYRLLLRSTKSPSLAGSNRRTRRSSRSGSNCKREISARWKYASWERIEWWSEFYDERELYAIDRTPNKLNVSTEVIDANSTIAQAEQQSLQADGNHARRRIQAIVRIWSSSRIIEIWFEIWRFEKRFFELFDRSDLCLISL